MFWFEELSWIHIIEAWGKFGVLISINALDLTFLDQKNNL